MYKDDESYGAKGYSEHPDYDEEKTDYLGETMKLKDLKTIHDYLYTLKSIKKGILRD